MWSRRRGVALLVALLAAASACTRGPAQPIPTETVALTVDHRTQRGMLFIEGTTDLPDGAALTFTVTHEAAHTIPIGEWPAPNLVESGRTVVYEGQFWARVPTTGWPAGQVRVLLQFPLPPQPPEVVTRYGEFGEKLSGDNVVTEGAIKMVEVEHAFDLRR